MQSVQGKPMSTDEINLLYRVFDSNKDGVSRRCAGPGVHFSDLD